jgi:hypothetical protein
MPKLNANTALIDPSTGAAVSLKAGQDIPDWATSLVGDHLIAAEPEAPAKPARGQKASQ